MVSRDEAGAWEMVGDAAPGAEGEGVEPAEVCVDFQMPALRAICDLGRGVR